MSIMFLSLLLVLGVLFGTVTPNLQILGKSALGGKSSESERRTLKNHLQQQTKSDSSRSLDFNSFNVDTTPTTKISLPTIIKLYPPDHKPVHLHANMPMRFGRQTISSEDQAPNMPQRFGRGWEMAQMCEKCIRVIERANAVLPQRFGRSNLSRRIFKTLISDQLQKKHIHWSRGTDFTVSPGEIETQDKT